MLDSTRTSRIAQLRARLAELDGHISAEMRRRGFDPAQADNVALPSLLARLSVERTKVADELEELIRETTIVEEEHGQ